MAADIQTLRPYLQDFDLTGLMVEGLGWNHHQGAPMRTMTCLSLRRPASPCTGAARNRTGPFHLKA